MHTLPSHAQDGKFTFIYGLKDPETQLIRYVGKSDNPKQRYYAHLNDKSITYKTCWIKGLLAKGLKPELVIFEKIPFAQWEKRECYWIAFYRELGIPLTNFTNGGDGVQGGNPSEETRRRMSEAHKGRIFSEQTRAKLREQKLKCNPMKGKKASEVTRAKMSAAHTGMKKVISPAHREKLRQANLGKKLSEGHRAKISTGGKRRYSLLKQGNQFPTLWDGCE